ncbi:MAG: chromosome segregation protein SMC [Anaerolineales bacterium]
MTAKNKEHSRLQTLELQGYKTFATKTTFEFAPTITAIVGPNGSGKSNIADAIRWVLGEQAYSLLRGKKTEDMIFSGSESRSRAGMAAATIRFDNTEGWLPIDFNEVSIGRRAYRDGQNEYLVNDQKVRLRDVSELLAESGLAERTYTIIGQGLVDTALSLRAEERRELFEEAAGIGLYRSRREEAVRRLESTRRNLERVKDILAELRPRLRSLERQAQRARDYEQVKEDLKSSLRVWYGYHWNRMQQVVGQASQAAKAQAEERRDLHEEQKRVDKELASTRRRIEQFREKLQSWSGEAGELYNRREEMARRQAVLEERIRWLEEQHGMIQGELSSLQAEHARAKKSADVAREEMQARSDEVQQLEEQAVGDGSGRTLKDRRELEAESNRLRKELEALAGREAAWHTREDQLKERREELELALDQVEQERALAQESRQELAAARNEAVKALEAANRQAMRLREQKSELEARSANLATSAEKQRQSLQSLQRKADQFQSRLMALRELAEGPQAGSQALLQAAERGEIAGVIGRLLSKVQVPSQHRRVVSTAMGELVGGLAVSTWSELEQALGFLAKQSDQGRTVLLPMEEDDGGERYYVPAPDDTDIVAHAAEVVSAEESLKPVIRRLLGRTWIVRDRSSAVRWRGQAPSDVQLVTPQGELFLPNGIVIVGPPSFGPDREGREELQRDLHKVEAEIEVVSGELAAVESEQDTVAARLGNVDLELDAAEQAEGASRQALRQIEIELREAESRVTSQQRRHQELSEALERTESRWQNLLSEGEAFEEQRARLERELTRSQRQFGDAQASQAADELELEWDRARTSFEDAEGRWKERKARAETLAEEVETWQRRLSANEEERATKDQELAEVRANSIEVEAALSARQEELDPVEQELDAAEKRRTELEKAESRLRFQIQAVENRHSQAQVELARREEELLGLQRRIEDDFGLVAYEYDESTTGQDPLPLEGLVEKLPNVDELPEGIETQVKRLRAQLRRMGSINPEAQEEYQHVRERMEFMTTRVDDLRDAESQIQEVIVELDVIMAREFRTTFEEVAAAFKDTFQQLFGGGSARLILIDPDDPNESGIEIEAKLPGKREQGLAVLSGGERSLAASALIFALLRVSPTPFCVLDEVDAMLDESNVIRFCELLQELSEKTQFIVITHNRQTVQVAQAVYGITMAADSTSRIISLDLEEAAQEVAA